MQVQPHFSSSHCDCVCKLVCATILLCLNLLIHQNMPVIHIQTYRYIYICMFLASMCVLHRSAFICYAQIHVSRKAKLYLETIVDVDADIIIKDFSNTI